MIITFLLLDKDTNEFFLYKLDSNLNLLIDQNKSVKITGVTW